jgi:hypothetical protein
MARVHSAQLEMGRLVQTHNLLRCAFATPGPVAHVVNENTVVRSAAAMEYHLGRRCRRRASARPKRHPTAQDLLGDWDPQTDWPDVCMRTLFLLRHFIVHLRGRYSPRSLTPSSRRLLLPAYRRFRSVVQAARVHEGHMLNLSAAEVIEPLLLGCRDYWKRNRRNRLGVAKTP